MRRTVDDASDFNRRAFQFYGFFFAFVAVVIAGLVYWQVWKRKKTEWEVNDPMALVKELNFVHQLSEQEKQLMRELSENNSLPSPLKLFVEPKFLLDALESDTFFDVQPSVRQLLSKLFGITTEESEISDVVGMDTELYSP